MRRINLVAALSAALLAVGACGGGGGDGGTDPGKTSDPVADPQDAAFIAETIGSSIDVYASDTSVKAGDTITFHLADHLGQAGHQRQAAVLIDRIGLATKTVFDGQASMSKRSLPDQAWRTCCDWPAGLTLSVAESWQSGLYRATFTAPDSAQTSTFFVVRSPNPGSGSSLVLQVPFDTAQAYNNWGGKSLYGYSSTKGIAANRVSNYRPSGQTQADDFSQWVIPMIAWAEKQGIALEYISSRDLQRNAAVLTPYRLFVTSGHDEYWSGEMRAVFDSFTANGGNAAIFSGNTMWWRTNFSSDGFGRNLGFLDCTKESGSVTSNWYTQQPEAASLGASFVRGGFLFAQQNPELANYPYTVYQADHWVFDGTGISNGVSFGGEQQILRYETDGVDLTFDATGRPQPTGGDGTPAGTKILALARLTGWDATTIIPNRRLNLSGEAGAWATMTIHTKPGGGTVFHAGTTDWARALRACNESGVQSVACQVTSNVFDRLSGNATAAAAGQ